MFQKVNNFYKGGSKFTFQKTVYQNTQPLKKVWNKCTLQKTFSHFHKQRFRITSSETNCAVETDQTQIQTAWMDSCVRHGRLNLASPTTLATQSDTLSLSRLLQTWIWDVPFRWAVFQPLVSLPVRLHGRSWSLAWTNRRISFSLFMSFNKLLAHYTVRGLEWRNVSLRSIISITHRFFFKITSKTTTNL